MFFQQGGDKYLVGLNEIMRYQTIINFIFTYGAMA